MKPSKMRDLAVLCKEPHIAGSESFYAVHCLNGGLNHMMHFAWAWRLWTQNDIDRKARRADVKLAAHVALVELAPQILADRCAGAWHADARRVLGESSLADILGL